MDRFIAQDYLRYLMNFEHLKSNMDRFIVPLVAV